MRSLTDEVEHLAHAVAVGVNQVKAFFINPVLVADGIQRVHHKIHRHQVKSPALQSNHGHPRGQPFAQALN